jgi:hypothetical protein
MDAFSESYDSVDFLKREVGICMDNDLGIAYIAIDIL